MTRSPAYESSAWCESVSKNSPLYIFYSRRCTKSAPKRAEGARSFRFSPFFLLFLVFCSFFFAILPFRFRRSRGNVSGTNKRSVSVEWVVMKHSRFSLAALLARLSFSQSCTVLLLFSLRFCSRRFFSYSFFFVFFFFLVLFLNVFCWCLAGVPFPVIKMKLLIDCPANCHSNGCTPLAQVRTPSISWLWTLGLWALSRRCPRLCVCQPARLRLPLADNR